MRYLPLAAGLLSVLTAAAILQQQFHKARMFRDADGIRYEKIEDGILYSFTDTHGNQLPLDEILVGKAAPPHPLVDAQHYIVGKPDKTGGEKIYIPPESQKYRDFLAMQKRFKFEYAKRKMEKRHTQERRAYATTIDGKSIWLEDTKPFGSLDKAFVGNKQVSLQSGEGKFYSELFAYLSRER